MVDHVRILCRRHELPLGRHFVTFEWQGPPTGEVLVSKDLWPELQRQAPWPLRITGMAEWDSYRVCRTDGWLRLPWALRRAREAVFGWWWPMFKARVIMTLMVWDLAHTPKGCIPHWGDIGRKRNA